MAGPQIYTDPTTGRQFYYDERGLGRWVDDPAPVPTPPIAAATTVPSSPLSPAEFRRLHPSPADSRRAGRRAVVVSLVGVGVALAGTAGGIVVWSARQDTVVTSGAAVGLTSRPAPTAPALGTTPAASSAAASAASPTSPASEAPSPIPPVPAKTTFKKLTPQGLRNVLTMPAAYEDKRYVLYGTVTSLRTVGSVVTFSANVDAAPHSDPARYRYQALLEGTARVLGDIAVGQRFQTWVEVVGTQTVEVDARTTKTYPLFLVRIMKIAAPPSTPDPAPLTA